jgi:hypothetical protein
MLRGEPAKEETDVVLFVQVSVSNCLNVGEAITNSVDYSLCKLQTCIGRLWVGFGQGGKLLNPFRLICNFFL